MNNLKLSNIERDKIFDTLILPSIIKGLESCKNPTVHILGGQPAAGKSYFIKKLIEQDKNTAIINGDDLRGYHPKYEYFLKHNEKEASDLIQEDINYWIEKAIIEISLKKYSMIVEGTLKNANVPIKTAKLLDNAGYFVNLNVILVNPEISKVDMIKRYLLQKKLIGFARFTKIDAQIETVNKIFSNILEVANQEEVSCLRLLRGEIDNYNLFYERNYEYDEANLKKILKIEQRRELTIKEIEYVDNSWGCITELLKEYKECSEIEEYIREVRKTKIEYKLPDSHNEFNFYEKKIESKET